mmetsp:Transcript_30921/g.90389  ORF Transcript_30921/g.90389 Transcript_30921/m.90389 type:complete len:216 (+) Transcript_30921:862-1509(+)
MFPSDICIHNDEGINPSSPKKSAEQAFFFFTARKVAISCHSKAILRTTSRLHVVVLLVSIVCCSGSNLNLNEKLWPGHCSLDCCSHWLVVGVDPIVPHCIHLLEISSNVLQPYRGSEQVAFRRSRLLQQIVHLGQHIFGLSLNIRRGGVGLTAYVDDAVVLDDPRHARIIDAYPFNRGKAPPRDVTAAVGTRTTGSSFFRERRAKNTSSQGRGAN